MRKPRTPRGRPAQRDLPLAPPAYPAYQPREAPKEPVDPWPPPEPVFPPEDREMPAPVFPEDLEDEWDDDPPSP